jgi:hypothetical protein
MTIVPFSLDPASEARALLRFMLAHGDIVGTHHARRTVLQRSKQLVFRCNRILFLLKSLCNRAPRPSHLSRRVATVRRRGSPQASPYAAVALPLKRRRS